jgi:FAD/FMN-containing dehydrogenase
MPVPVGRDEHVTAARPGGGDAARERESAARERGLASREGALAGRERGFAAREGALAARLAEVVGERHVLTDDDMTAGYAVDWTGAYAGRAAAVVRPGSAGEVAEVLRACAAARVPVIPQGGNTSLVGGSVPVGEGSGAVVLSLRRLDRVSSVDLGAGLVTAEAGATLAAVQAAASAAGAAVGVDLAARDSATLGGIAATNAGGERVLRHGTARAQIAGIEAVLAGGGVLRRMTGLPKDNVGYDLTGLLVGSEGTLGVITALQLRLVPPRPARTAALVAMVDMAAAVAIVGRLRLGLSCLDAAELMFADGLEMVCDHRGLPWPLPAATRAGGRARGGAGGAYLLLECAGRDDPTDALAAALDDAAGVVDVAVGMSAADRERLWAYREAHTEAVNALGAPLKLDVSVPLGRIAAFVAELAPLVSSLAPGARLHLWGHLAEANLHVNVTGIGRDDAAGRERVSAGVLRSVAASGGSIGAEHGVGRAKAAWMGLSRTPAELAALACVKHALDPDCLLNPGVVVPAYGMATAAR